MCWSVLASLLVVGGVADLSQGLASLSNLVLVGSKTVSEGVQDLGANLGVVTGGTEMQKGT